MVHDRNQTWEYVARKDLKTGDPIADPTGVLETLLRSPVHRYLRASDGTTRVFVDYLPVHGIYRKPHFHLEPDEGRLRVIPFADTTSAESPQLLDADYSSVTFTIGDIAATVCYLPQGRPARTRVVSDSLVVLDGIRP